MAEGLSAAAANALLDTHHDTTYAFVQLHTAAPGAAGTTAVAGNATRKDTSAAWAAAASGSKVTDVDIDWSDAEVDTGEDYTHVSFWTLASGGTFGGSGTLTANAVAASGDSFSILAGGMTASFTVAS
jgi:hypothetical protein